MSSPSRQTGPVIAGRYRIDRRLSSGGMGDVYLAHDPDGRAMAMKLIGLDTTSGSARSRFQREARLAASFNHPHIVRVHDYGRSAEEGEERFFLLMDLVEGPTLSAWLARQSMPVGVGIELIRQLLSALGYLHARDVIHRDIKPANLLVARRADGSLSLALVDFGMAAELRDRPRITRDGQALGTPSYMAPEQARAETISPAADLYAVGVILYELLAGTPPFSGTTPEILYGKMTRTAPALSPDCGPEPLRELVAELLAQDPEARPRAAETVRQRLAPFADEAVIDSAQWGELADPVPPAATATSLEIRPQARVEGSDLWGREDERARLVKLAFASERGEGHIVVLRGDVGMGKSALVRDVELSLREQGRFQAIRSESSTRGILRGLRRAIERSLHCLDESRAVLRRAVRRLLRRSIEGEEDDAEVEALLDFLRPPGIAGEPQAQERAFAIVTRLLRRMSKLQPVLLVIEGAHHAGEDVSAWLDHLLFELRIEDMPLLVVVTKRPRLGERTGIQLPASPRVASMDLEPLDDEQIDRGLHRAYGLAPERRARVVQLAGGNPSFARMLASIDHLPTQKTGSETLPDPLYDILSQLLRERLALHERTEAMRQLMLCLAVLGGRARESQLCTLTLQDASQLDAFEDDLDRLIGLRLLQEDAGEQIAFVHPLMRDVLIADGQPRGLRRLHRRAAELRMRDGDREAGWVGDHLLAARRSDEAVTWWLRAQRFCFFAGETRQAEHWGRRAVEHLPAEAAERAEAVLLLGRVLRETLQYERAVELLTPELAAFNEEHGMLAAELVAEVRQEMGDEAGWRECIEHVRDHLPASPGRGRRAGLRALAFWSNHLLELAEAEAFATEALSGSEPHLDEWVSAQKRRFWALFYQVDLDTAAVVASEMIARGKQDKRSDVEAEGHRFMGKIHQLTPSYEESLAAYERALALQRMLGRQSRVTNLYQDIMFVACTAEDVTTTRHYLDLFHRVVPEPRLDFTGVLVRLTELRCRALSSQDAISHEVEALYQRVASTQWGFRHAIKGEWLWSLVREGKSEPIMDELKAHLEAAGELPPLVWYAKLLAYLGRDLSEDPSTASLSQLAFEQAAMVYKRLHNEGLARDMIERAATLA